MKIPQSPVTTWSLFSFHAAHYQKLHVQLSRQYLQDQMTGLLLIYQCFLLHIVEVSLLGAYIFTTSIADEALRKVSCQIVFTESWLFPQNSNFKLRIPTLNSESWLQTHHSDIFSSDTKLTSKILFLRILVLNSPFFFFFQNPKFWFRILTKNSESQLLHLHLLNPEFKLRLLVLNSPFWLCMSLLQSSRDILLAVLKDLGDLQQRQDRCGRVSRWILK